MKARENPFATDRVLRIRYRLDGETWEELLARLAALRYRAAIVGPPGSGKTTLLEDLEPHLRARGFGIRYLRLNDRARRVPADFYAGTRDIILVDGAELLNWWAWQRFRWQTRGAAGLVVTAHRAGLLPTVRDCRTSPELLAEIAGELRGAPVGNCRELYERHAGNLRDCLRTLYDGTLEVCKGIHQAPQVALRIRQRTSRRRSSTAISASRSAPLRV